MINFYNDRLAPYMLCKLLYDVVPERFHRPVIFSYGKRHMLEGHQRSLGVTDYKRVWLNLEAIAFNGFYINCSIQAGIWREMLRVGFHEFGHIAHKHWQYPVQKGKVWWPRRQIEEHEADQKAEEWIARVLAVDGRIYQPTYLGVVDLIRTRRRKKMREQMPKSEMSCSQLKDWRCHITGGQLSLGDMVRALSSFYPDLSITPWLIHRLGDDLARVHVDKARRRHRFWIWGDTPVIRRRLAGVQLHPKKSKVVRYIPPSDATAHDVDISWLEDSLCFNVSFKRAT